MIIFMFALLFAMCLVGAILFAIWTKNLSPHMWYLAPDQAPTAFDPRQPILAGVYSFVTSFVLYGYLIPISLYVSLEMVKVCQVDCPLLAVPLSKLAALAAITANRLFTSCQRRASLRCNLMQIECSSCA